MNKKRIAAALTVFAMLVVGAAGCGEKNAADQQQAEKVTPTFMYFISESDADFEATNSMIEELQDKYSDDINFTILNITMDTEALKNFPLVEGNTPALIMLNTSNDISAMEFQCSDKAKLEDDIKAALQ